MRRFGALVAVSLLVSLAVPAVVTVPASAAPANRFVAATGTAGTNADCSDPGYIGFDGLKAAIAAAGDSSTVTVCPGTITFTESITVSQKQITITGSGAASASILDGGNATRLFTILSKKSVTIQNLTLQNANAVGMNGGAVYFDVGNATYFDANTHHVIKDSAFYRNYAGGTYGGAISAHGYGGPNSYDFANASSIEVSGNTFIENSAAYDGGAIGGGAFGSSSATTGLIITGNTFAYNRANNRSGGAVAVSHSSFVFLNNSVFENRAGWTGKSLSGEVKSSGNTVVNSGSFTTSVPVCAIPMQSRVLTLDGALDSAVEEDWTNNAYCGVFPVESRTAVMPIFIETTTASALARIGSIQPESPKATSSAGIDAGIRINLDTVRSEGTATRTEYEYSFDKTTFTGFGASSASATSLDIAGLTNGTSYTVYLRANNAAGVPSLLSTAITVTAGVPPSAPSKPTNLSASQSSASTIDLTFTPPASNGGSAITGYWIYGIGTGYIFKSYAAQTSFSITGLAMGQVHRFRLFAANAIGWSLASNWSNLVTMETPTATPQSQGPPNLIKFTSLPTLSLSGNSATCSAGAAEFWRASVTQETAKLDRVLFTLTAAGNEVSTVSSSTNDPHAKPSSTSPATATTAQATWKLAASDLQFPLTCSEVAFQENTSASTQSSPVEDPQQLAAAAKRTAESAQAASAAASAVAAMQQQVNDFISTPVPQTRLQKFIRCQKAGSAKRALIKANRCPTGYTRY